MQTQNIPKLIALMSGIITLALTPWVNSDSLIIPKMILLFCLALFLVPNLFYIKKSISHDFRLKLFFLIITCNIVQLFIVIFVSNAPIEQQVFGRSGRGLGLITQLSLIIILVVTVITIKFKDLKYINIYLIIASLISSTYSIIQYLGIDIFSWSSRTNGIIGTIGNPNFQSAFTAMAIAPIIVNLGSNNKKIKGFLLVSILISLFTIYICKSTQGYIGAALACSVIISLFYWYKNRIIFYGIFSSLLVLGIVTIAGMANFGPLKFFLFKASVTSRGEFWRTAVSAIKDNAFFGVGLDSFGDVSSFYKSAQDSLGINEFTDNAHNYLLEYSATGGLPLGILNLFLILLTLIAFFSIQKKIGHFEKNLAALFSAWVVFEAQSLISPATIPLMLWNCIISGFFIGVSCRSNNTEQQELIYDNNKISRKKQKLGVVFLVVGIFITFPLFNADRIFLKSINSGNAELAVKAAIMYPESTNRYTKVGVELLKSNLPDQALLVAKAAIKFNPNSTYSWLLLLANEKANPAERNKAKSEILRLDPHNLEIKSLAIPLQ